jgi:ABC-type proline/glycine betaine transport system ATPase subunit
MVTHDRDEATALASKILDWSELQPRSMPAPP